MYAPPLRYKREALAVHTKDTDSRWTQHQRCQDSLKTKVIQHTVDVEYYALVARTTLNLLCSSCSSSEIELVLANPLSTHPLSLGGCITSPGCGFAHHDTVLKGSAFGTALGVPVQKTGTKGSLQPVP